MATRYKLISKMVLAVVSGFLAVLFAIGAVFSTAEIVKDLPNSRRALATPGGDTSHMLSNATYIIAITIIAYGLAVLFGWLCIRNARKWREF